MNLDRAKELKQKIEIFTIESKKKKYKKGYFDTFLEKLKQEVIELKEKVEKGCRVYYPRNGLPKDYSVAKCGDNSKYKYDININGKIICYDCQKTLKILNKILGEEE